MHSIAERPFRSISAFFLMEEMSIFFHCLLSGMHM
uniref:Uncharacterized protein n=1 Tax=Arundo donax TaxID=35708 RepID=A0A0A8XYX1_ARUDO